MPDEGEDIEQFSFDDFFARFKALSEEATVYGLDSVFLMREHDRLERTEQFNGYYSSGMTLAIGMLERGKQWASAGDDGDED